MYSDLKQQDFFFFFCINSIIDDSLNLLAVTVLPLLMTVEYFYLLITFLYPLHRYVQISMSVLGSFQMLKCVFNSALKTKQYCKMTHVKENTCPVDRMCVDTVV